MENNQVLETDAGIDTQIHNRGGRKNEGAEVLIGPTDSIDPNVLDTESEESPLLGNSTNRNNSDGGNGDDAPWAGVADLEGLSWWHRPSVFWLLPAFLLFTLAFGGIIVPKLNLTLSLVCRQYLADRASIDPAFTFLPVQPLGDNPQCRQNPEVQSLVTRFTLYMNLVAGILSAVASPKLGALSDRYGRKKILAITTMGGLCAEVVTILAATYPDIIAYQWLLLGSVFDGMCGSFIAGMALTHSYATDCTAPPKRAVAFGYFHACLFSGIAIGPLFAAYIVKMTGEILSIFYVALCCHTLFVLFIVFVVPESLTKARQMIAREKHRLEKARADKTWMGALKSLNLLAPLKVLYPSNPTNSPTVAAVRRNLILLSAVDAIVFGTAMGAVTVVIYYSTYEFGWGTIETSIFVSISNSCRVSALVIILPLLNYMLRTRKRNQARRDSFAAGFDGYVAPEKNSGSDSLDIWTIRVSVLFEFIGYGGYAVVRTGPLFIMSGVFASFGGIGSPTLQSALTKHVPHERTGQLLGATGLLHALMRIICPLVFGLIYSVTVGKFSQTVFVVISGCFVAAFAVSWFIKPNIYLEESGAAVRVHGAEEERLIDEEIAAM